GIKQVYRMVDEHGNFYGADAITLEEEEKITTMYHPFEIEKSLTIENFTHEPLLHKVMEKGKSLLEDQTLLQIASYAQQRLKKLPEEYRRFQYPHIYKVGISENLRNLREELRKKYKKGI